MGKEYNPRALKRRHRMYCRSSHGICRAVMASCLCIMVMGGYPSAASIRLGILSFPYPKFKRRASLLLFLRASGFAVFGVLLFAHSLRGQSNTSYVGASACARCHAADYRHWSESQHSQMMQRPTARTVKGNFAAGKVVLGDSKYVVERRNGKYFITESDLTSKP